MNYENTESRCKTMIYFSEDKTQRCIVFANYIIENNATVRSAAAKFGISKSTVHKDITEKQQYVNPALYEAVKKILEKNKAERHMRGGEATKNKYIKEKEIKMINEVKLHTGNLLHSKA